MPVKIIAHEDGTLEAMYRAEIANVEEVDFVLDSNQEEYGVSLTACLPQKGSPFLLLIDENGMSSITIGRDTYEMLRRDLGHPRRNE